MATDIITVNPLSISTAKFNSAHLNKCTQRIAAIYADASKYVEQKNRELASILAEVADRHSYEEDGFTSVAEYAETTFGIKKASAYALATAGRIYNDKAIPDSVKTLSPSKVVEVSNVDPKVIDDAMKSGKLSKDTTQKELRTFAQLNTTKSAEKTDGKVTIIPDYTARPHMYQETYADVIDKLTTPRPLEMWVDMIKASIAEDGTVEVIKLPNAKTAPDAKRSVIQRRLFFTEYFSVVVSFYPAKLGNKSVSHEPDPVKHYTKEELEKMIKELEEADAKVHAARTEKAMEQE